MGEGAWGDVQGAGVYSADMSLFRETTTDCINTISDDYRRFCVLPYPKTRGL